MLAYFSKLGLLVPARLIADSKFQPLIDAARDVESAMPQRL